MDYEFFKVMWWLFIAVLLIGFSVMDGHDMGIGMMLPFVGKNDVERRVIVNSIGAHWEGNQVWLVAGAGSIFAAWPMVYATAFSGFYWAMLAVLWAMFFRPVGFKYRSMVSNPTWRNTWDWGLFVGSFVPALIFGVAFGNLLLGVPFHFDNNLYSYYTGSFWALLNPFALLCGLVSVFMMLAHGGLYLAHRTEGVIRERSLKVMTVAAVITLVLFTAAGFWVAGIDGYRITSVIDTNGFPDVLGKTVELAKGAWLDNFRAEPALWAVPAAAYVGLLLAVWMARMGKTFTAFWFSAIGLGGIAATAGVAMFPFIMPSSSMPASSLTVWDGTSSHFTLIVMTFVVCILLPIIVIYTSWAFRVMRGKVTAEYIRENDHTLY
ncbi:cytochrome d ubiquinol oxidase subunit II [Neisseria perflava]|uniref:cytochrome d ubiquinol oxidase subunit II n=1 Tax=Neisseria perflava TaxID=33053 RepID=UPI00209DFD77|nr:cytochrome d ubiquinol oxidase subunit II [Neisseria perflava]MCP1772501.1 cytochrome d ubiquinol oxidase subunit II [Neisseria perflava]